MRCTYPLVPVRGRTEFGIGSERRLYCESVCVLLKFTQDFAAYSLRHKNNIILKQTLEALPLSTIN
jgi:hypothetical protein